MRFPVTLKLTAFPPGFLIAMAAITVGVSACQSQTQVSETPSNQVAQPVQGASTVALYGAGATFPSFLYLRWFQEYNSQHPNVQVSYQPVGSAAGIQQFMSETVDFAASDIPLTENEISQVGRGIVLLPMTAGSVAVVYNLPGVESGLKLSREILPEIFLGEITQWNDPKIAALNPDITLPDLPIILIHRSDGSGTTAVFTNHLSTISAAWQEQVGSGLSVQWPAGIGVKDNAGVSAQILQAEGTIGYVEYAFAKQLELSTVALENQAGQYVQPTDESTAKALATVKVPENLRVTVPDPEGSDSYPIVTYSWILAYKQYDDPAKAEVLQEVLQWGLTEGQKFGPELGYVPLSPDVARRVSAAVEQISP